MKHCPICNRSSAEARFYGEFCEFCAGDKLRSKLPRDAELDLCRDCGRIKVAGKFVPHTSATMEQFLASKCRPYRLKLIHSGNGIARVLITDEEHYGTSIEHNIHIKVRRILCDSDIKKHGGYYEAVVQLRGSEERVARTAAALGRYLEKNGAFVAKVEEKEHGVDVYASDKKAAASFISSRHLKFKVSFELHGEKRGKRLYRNTYFITL